MTGSSGQDGVQSQTSNGKIDLNPSNKGKGRQVAREEEEKEKAKEKDEELDYESDEQPSSLLVGKAVKLIRYQANEPPKNIYLTRALESYRSDYPDRPQSKQSPKEVIYPSLYSDQGSLFDLQPQYRYKSRPDTISWLNQMESIIRGGKNGGADGNEGIRRGLRGHRESKGIGIQTQLASYRKLEKEKKIRLRQDQKWKDDYDQSRIKDGKKPYFSRRKRPLDPEDQEDDHLSSRKRVQESPELSTDEEEELDLYNAPGRPDFFRRRLENSELPINLLKLYDDIREWSSSSESGTSDEEDAFNPELPSNDVEGMRLHLERKGRRERLRIEQDGRHPLNPQSGKSNPDQTQPLKAESELKPQEGDEDSLLDENPAEVHNTEGEVQGEEVGMEVDSRSVVPTSDREEALSQVSSGDSDSAIEEVEDRADVEMDQVRLEERQEANWQKEDDGRQRHSSSTRPKSQASNSSQGIQASRSSSSKLGAQKLTPAKGNSLSSQRKSSSNLLFDPSPKSSKVPPFHSTPILKEPKSKTKTSSPTPQHSSDSTSPQEAELSLKLASNQKDELSDSKVEKPQEGSQQADNFILALARASASTSQSVLNPNKDDSTTASSSAIEHRFETNKHNTAASMTQPTSNRKDAKSTSPSKRLASSQNSARANSSAPVDFQGEKKRVLMEREARVTEEQNEADGKATEGVQRLQEGGYEEEEEEEEGEEEVDQLESTQSQSQSQSQANAHAQTQSSKGKSKEQQQSQDSLDRFLPKANSGSSKQKVVDEELHSEIKPKDDQDGEDTMEKEVEKESRDAKQNTPTKGKSQFGSRVGRMTTSSGPSKTSTPKEVMSSPLPGDTLVTLNGSPPPDGVGVPSPLLKVTSASSPNRDRSNLESQTSPRISNKSKSQTESSLVITPPRNEGDADKKLTHKKQIQDRDLLSPKSAHSFSSRSSAAGKNSPSNRSFSSHTQLMMASALQASPSRRGRDHGASTDGSIQSEAGSSERIAKKALDEEGEAVEEEIRERETTPAAGKGKRERVELIQSKDVDIEGASQDELRDQSQDQEASTPAQISNSQPVKAKKPASQSEFKKTFSLSQSPSSSSKSKRSVEVGDFAKVKGLKADEDIIGSGKQKERLDTFDDDEMENGFTSSGSSVDINGANSRIEEEDQEAENAGSGSEKGKGKKRWRAEDVEADQGNMEDVESEGKEGKNDFASENEDRTPKRKKGDEEWNAKGLGSHLGAVEDEAPSPSAIQVQKQL